MPALSLHVQYQHVLASCEANTCGGCIRSPFSFRSNSLTCDSKSLKCLRDTRISQLSLPGHCQTGVTGGVQMQWPFCLVPTRVGWGAQGRTEGGCVVWGKLSQLTLPDKPSPPEPLQLTFLSSHATHVSYTCLDGWLSKIPPVGTNL